VSSRGREAPATVPSMLDIMSTEVVNATAHAHVTEAAVDKVKEVLVKIATVNVEDSCIAAWAARVTDIPGRQALLECVRAVQGPRQFWVSHHGDSSVSRRGRHGVSRRGRRGPD